MQLVLTGIEDRAACGISVHGAVYPLPFSPPRCAISPEMGLGLLFPLRPRSFPVDTAGIQLPTVKPPGTTGTASTFSSPLHLGVSGAWLVDM